VNALPETLSRPIRRADLEAKLRELRGEVDETAEGARSSLVTIGTVVLVGVVVGAFLLGKRKGRRRSTVVEVRRI
jgi:hypothetical protein